MQTMEGRSWGKRREAVSPSGQLGSRNRRGGGATSFRQIDHDGDDAQRGQRQEDEGQHDYTGCVASLKYPGALLRTQ